MAMKHIFIIGSKGIPAAYGGFESFVEKLIEYKKDNEIQYHVACKNMDVEEKTYHNARCFNVTVPNVGAVQAVYYDIKSINKCCKYILDNNINNGVIYILACRIGPFLAYFKRKLDKMNVQIFLNPDGHEWMRAKWNCIIKKYWKISERWMVSKSDLIICDSKNIERYINNQYKKYSKETIFIPYGAEICGDTGGNKNGMAEWLNKNELSRNKYYLAVGRFVPENNFECMISEFMKSNSEKDFVIITEARGSFYKKLLLRTQFDKDRRIRFVGTVYDRELLMNIRENAYGYLHGHEVGGTNPSLLEALGSTKLNLLLSVGFNQEVGRNAALYWKKEIGDLKKVIEYTDGLTIQEIDDFGQLAKQQIRERYSWREVCEKYENVFSQTIKFTK